MIDETRRDGNISFFIFFHNNIEAYEGETIFMYLYIFFIYSFIGWFYESTICSIVINKKLINRGFLHGPACPIYGIGAVTNWILFSDVENLFALFFASAFVSGFIEYVVSVLLEEIFNARWWNYSNFKFNLNGRVCLYGIILFGVANTCMVLYFTPKLLTYYNTYQYIFDYITTILFIVLLIDLFITLNNWLVLTERLEEIKTAIKNKELQLPKLKIPRKELRILKAFPKLKFINNDDNSILDKIRKINLDEIKNKKNKKETH